MKTQPVRTCRVERDTDRALFIQSLAEDMRLAGNQVTVRHGVTGSEYHFDPRTLSQHDVTTAYRDIRLRNLQEQLHFVLQMEKRGIARLFRDGLAIEIEAITPEIKICTTDADKNIYRYCRQLQSVPTSSGTGRRFSILVFDVGQKKPALMGVIGLTGSAYFLRDRDTFLGWGSDDSATENKRRKDEGLRRLMHLSVCLALQPYNWLYGAKLMALLALSDPVRNYYLARYHEPLLGIVTTTATQQSHCPIFNRIELNKLPEGNKYQRERPNQMYLHIGTTARRTTTVLSQRTVNLARIVAKMAGESPLKPPEAGKLRSDRSKDRVVYIAMSLCGISRSVFDLKNKALYFAYLHEAEKAHLADSRSLEPALVSLTVEDAVTYWRDRWCAKAQEDPTRLDRFRQFTGREISLARELRLLL